MRVPFLVVLLAGLLLAPASAQSTVETSAIDTTKLWTGKVQLDEDSLFSQFRAYKEDRRYVGEPILDGEALPAFLSRLGLDAGDAEAAASAFLAEAGVDSLAPGTSVRLKFAKSPTTVHQLAAGGFPRGLDAMQALVGGDTLVTIERTAEGFLARSRAVEVERRYVAAAGVINRSIFSAAKNAGVPREMMLRFAEIFAFDVDFAREVYQGDRFEIVYELLFDQSGRALGYGDILFAALTWQGGKNARGYYRFHAPGTEDANYYSAEGRNPRTLLMKTPINGARVTSRFGRRRHPVLGYTKGHAGIDFGAPTGTPIMAAGDGVIEIAGPRGTFGNYIRIEHDGKLKTAYAHLNSFAEGIEPGEPVRQGEVIGYVGTTGRSTGPHLHYEVLLSGKPQNPETVKVATGETLRDEGLEAFLTRKEAFDTLRLEPFAVAEARVP